MCKQQGDWQPDNSVPELEIFLLRASYQGFIPPVAQTIKNLLAMQETQVRSLGWEDSPGGGNGFLLWQEAMQKQVLPAYEVR